MEHGKVENQYLDYQMSSKKALVVLAAGLGSRYKSLKQVDGITDNNSPLLEYAIYDALKVGFTKVILIINKLVPDSYIQRIKKIAHDQFFDLRLVYQELHNHVPIGLDISTREKPWGTAHALLCIENEIEEEFIIINADDFYGKEAYKKASDIINNHHVIDNGHHIIAYPLHLTTSDNGAVSRGICELTKEHYLSKVTERTEIYDENNEIFFFENNKKVVLKPETLASMNFSIFHPSIFTDLKERFQKFAKINTNNKVEFFIPQLIEDLLQEKKISVKVHQAPSQWMGVTYPEDKAKLKIFIEEKIKLGDYPENLWN